MNIYYIIICILGIIGIVIATSMGIYLIRRANSRIEHNPAKFVEGRIVVDLKDWDKQVGHFDVIIKEGQIKIDGHFEAQGNLTLLPVHNK